MLCKHSFNIIGNDACFLQCCIKIMRCWKSCVIAHKIRAGVVAGHTDTLWMNWLFSAFRICGQAKSHNIQYEYSWLDSNKFNINLIINITAPYDGRPAFAHWSPGKSLKKNDKYLLNVSWSGRRYPAFSINVRGHSKQPAIARIPTNIFVSYLLVKHITHTFDKATNRIMKEINIHNLTYSRWDKIHWLFHCIYSMLQYSTSRCNHLTTMMVVLQSLFYEQIKIWQMMNATIRT